MFSMGDTILVNCEIVLFGLSFCKKDQKCCEIVKQVCPENCKNRLEKHREM